MAIVEVFLGAILTVLLEKLDSGELLKFLRRVGIEAQIKEWHATLSTIEAVLTDAENKQTENKGVKLWLNDLEDLAYDLEDLVDELNAEASLRKIRENEGSTSKVKKLIPTCCTNLSLNDFMLERGIASKLKEISSRLEALSKREKMLNLVKNVRGRPYERWPTSSLVVESEVYGREEDKAKIIEILESNDDLVIPIVGMGGVGKTTLVQLVYNDERLKDKFDTKAWACVSDEFDPIKVTKSILEEVSSGERCDSDNFNTLQVKLEKSLLKKKFLVVLDDIWNEKYEDWDILRRPFLAGERGSKIIITTRNVRVAEIMSKIPAYNLNVLSEVDALSLLAQHAFGVKTFDGHPDLIKIGISMVRRCENLPLAVKALGGLLRTADGPEKWTEVLESAIWIAEGTSEILPALKLSYHYLRPELKRCFAYCALFPKHYEFDKFHLVHFWMAEGLVQQEPIEEVGSHYFDKLLARSFFQKSIANASPFEMHDSFGMQDRFVMHGLFNDLAMSVAGDNCLRMDVELKENLPSTISEKVRHLSFMRHRYETYPRFNILDRVQKLRTFLPLTVDKSLYDTGSQDFLSHRILFRLLPNLSCLRVLSLNDYSIYELPDSIGDFRHLRYLGLARTSLKWLPESVSTLINLQVLILIGCRNLTKLPTSMENLINLRHLDIASTPKLHEMPQGIAQLASLRTLTKMTASKNNGMRLKDLGNLSFLQGDISIEELQNVANVQDAMDANLSDKPSLSKIRLAWSKDYDDSRNKFFELELLNALKPHENLSTLEIKYFGGESFSNWIGDSAFFKLAKISFNFCKNCTALPPLGQLPLLRDLSIRGIDQVKVIGAEFYGNRGHEELPFPSLVSLTFEDMSNWEEWHGIEGVIKLPWLCELKIKGCSKLIRVPDLFLPSLHELIATECNEVVLNHMKNLESLAEIKLTKIFGLTSVIKAFVQFPFTLESFEVDGCDDLVTLWPSDNTVRNLVNLREVHVRSCYQLLSLQEIDVLPRLRILEIERCGALELLPDKMTCLERLKISECPSLKMMMMLQDCCTLLSELFIGNWVNWNWLGPGHTYQSLNVLELCYCDGLESFPHGGLPTPNLKAISICHCQHLKSLPERMDLLSSLMGLRVINCASLRELFPQENIPPILSYLDVKICGKLKPLGEWGLHKLTSLNFFGFSRCPELISLTNNRDEEHCVLPPSLIYLTLDDLPNLETLSKGFQKLTSLQLLFIRKCPKLEALPMEDQLKKLSRLEIKDCPLLKKQCLKNKGDYWPIIADIPLVVIDDRSIYNPCP
ncbi:disease resistance RPP13 1 [Olea europaea subsp. europaea]|uniref:Disease resistance RPP13 1 n=1 Tax=Olea europaea subsp. europaea TaxID=158383 RepID=A0A8S0SMI3_OLEEU|nr:disease resistance RPP13 1 [Olea europaea subsp. europaea]